MGELREHERVARGRSGSTGALARPTPRWLASGRSVKPAELPMLAGTWLRDGLRDEVEGRRLFAWIAVAYGVGILLGLVADGPPSLWPPLGLGLGFCILAYLGRARLGRQAALVALAALFLGFAAALLRLEAVKAPVLQRMSVAKVTGFVESVEERTGGGRLVLRVLSIDKLAEAERPERVRLSVRSLDGIAPGDRVSAAARMMPPPEAARPGGYDFARDAYFRGLGAVGSVSGRVTKVEVGDRPDLALRFAAATDRARNALTSRIAASIGGQAGAVAAALVTGKRGLIEEGTNDVLRAAGIYHVVSISGLHMVLAAGVFFALARGLLALSPALALGWPIKKIAALVGMAAASAYCVFSGAEVATERSLVMILVMQGAILFDRPAMSMRNLAISALIVLTREPEALLGPSFQMSYGAVAGLITLAEGLRRWRRPAEPGDPLKRAALWVGAVVVGTIATTLIATIATAPFGTYHFHNLQPYGLLGNAATLPLVSFAVMPAGVLGILALPFGVDQPIWRTMGLAVSGVLKLSAWVASFPSSTVVTPAFGGFAMGLFALALLFATLPGARLRLLAVIPLAGGLASAHSAPRPDVYVARDGSGAAVRRADGRLVVLGPVANFTIEQWLRADGDGRRASDPSLRDPGRCDAIGCTALLGDGRAVSLLVDRRGFEEDCRRAAIVVSRHAAPASCAAATILDRSHLATHGATTLRATPSGLVMETVRRPGAGRPWLVEAKAPVRTAARPGNPTPHVVEPDIAVPEPPLDAEP